MTITEEYPISTLSGETQKEFIDFVERKRIEAKIEILTSILNKGVVCNSVLRRLVIELKKQLT